jgi:hypothetical protein
MPTRRRMAQGPPSHPSCSVPKGIPNFNKTHYALASNIRYASSNCENSCAFLHVHIQETLSSCDFRILRQLPNIGQATRQRHTSKAVQHGSMTFTQQFRSLGVQRRLPNHRHSPRTVIVFGRSHSCTMLLAVAPRPRAHSTVFTRAIP